MKCCNLSVETTIAAAAAAIKPPQNVWIFNADILKCITNKLPANKPEMIAIQGTPSMKMVDEEEEEEQQQEEQEQEQEEARKLPSEGGFKHLRAAAIEERLGRFRNAIESQQTRRQHPLRRGTGPSAAQARGANKRTSKQNKTKQNKQNLLSEAHPRRQTASTASSSRVACLDRIGGSGK
jgi:hypothetical protein